MIKSAIRVLAPTAAALVALSIAAPAQAGPTAGQLLASFNLITTGNVTTTDDIEGAAVIGGNLSGATFLNGSVLPANKSIYLYGSLTDDINIDNGGNIYYAGSTSGKVNFNGGGQHFTTLPNPLSYYTAPLNQLSTTLAALAPTAGASISNGNFDANGATGLVVFDVTAAQLNSDLQNSQITFTGAGVTGFIVNVSGNYAEAGGINFNTPQQDALFNFYNATSVALGNWKTSVLAPDASLTIQNGYLAGSVYVASFAGGGELHNDNLYDGALPGSPSVPEPATWTMMLVGFGTVGWAIRKRSLRSAVTSC